MRRNRPWGSPLVWALLLGMGLPAVGGQDGDRRAPDGRRGLGPEPEVRDLSRLFHSSDPADEAFLGALYDLPSEVDVMVGTLREEYRARGYFAILEEADEVNLENLHLRFDRMALDPLVAMSEGGESARAFAACFVDPRFRVRRTILEGWRREADELLRGMAVLRGPSENWIEIHFEESNQIATRVDLAASRLRSLKTDLSALRPKEFGAGGPGEPKIQAMLDLLQLADRGERLLGLARLEAQVQRAHNQMLGMLSITRLDEHVEPLLAWRDGVLAQVESIRAQAVLWFPEGEDPIDLPREVAREDRGDRMRYAHEFALSGLSYDPMDEELVWITARANDYKWSRLRSRPWYDRYLALRGISSRDDRTYRHRTLTERERTALFEVQQPAIGDPTGRGR